MNASSPETELVLSPLDAAFETKRSRYVVGIDLGTTNCAVAYMDTHQANPTIETFRVEQMVDFQTSQKSDTLPSFHYELTSAEAQQIDVRFQFADGSHKSIVGIFARQRGMQMPGRCIASAKSWLCHTLVDRSSELLPWSGDEGVRLLSPVQASRRYLEHIRRMWDREHPTESLAQQDVIVTLPASFDEVARQLTIQAATEAGLPQVILIEEPQAAFYAWLHRNQDTWMQTMRAGQSILVCDIGGGTTDFTLIRVVPAAATKTPESIAKGSASANKSLDLSEEVTQSLQATFGLHRVAVGEHLMLGGDNLDLALARSLEQRLLAESPGQDRLRPRQWDALKAQCRAAKEVLLGPAPPSEYKMSLPGSGSKLVENTRALGIEYEWAKSLLVDGFFGRVAITERPNKDAEGFQEFGLPYAAEPNVNKHLAAFLWEHRWAGRNESNRSSMTDLHAARPDWVLFNGGVLESTQIRDAILDQIAEWFRDVSADDAEGVTWKPGVLQGNRLDLAVAQGAAYFGLVRRGQGVRIDARLAKAYYLLVEQSPPRAMCVMPANAMPLDRYRMDKHPFELTVGQPVQFPLLQSSTNLIHVPGEIVPVDLQSMSAMPAIRTVLEIGNRKNQGTVPVVLESELSEIGTLAMNLALDSSEGPLPAFPFLDLHTSWKLEFDVRAIPNMDGTGPDADTELVSVVQTSEVNAMLEAMQEVFCETSSVLPKNGIAQLSERVGKGRSEWSPTVLREMWRFLLEHDGYRKLSSEHESRWLNLVGWSLRPGFGMAADDWRVNTTWRQVHNKLMHRSAANASETIVLWRRIAGGFTAGQQRALFQDCWTRIRGGLSGGAANQSMSTNVTIELLRLIGSLEWLTTDDKIAVAEQSISALSRKKLEPLHGPLLWTIGRLGSRAPVYATLQQVVNASRIQSWVDKILALDSGWMEKNVAMLSLCLMQLTRRTGDRYRDVPSTLRQRVATKLQELGASPLHIDLILKEGRLDETSTESIVGDSLPLGFRLASPGLV